MASASAVLYCLTLLPLHYQTGGLAQLVRAPALHAGGPGFESLILHCSKLFLDSSKRGRLPYFFRFFIGSIPMSSACDLHLIQHLCCLNVENKSSLTRLGECNSRGHSDSSE